METRWSLINLLHGPENDDAWRWFVDCYSPLVARALARRLWTQPLETSVSEFWSWSFERRLAEKADRSRPFRWFLYANIKLFVAESYRKAKHATVWDEEPRAVSTTVEDDDYADWAAHILRLALEDLRGDHPTWARALELYYDLKDTRTPAQSRLKASQVGRILGVGNAAGMLKSGRDDLRAKLVRRITETVMSEEQRQDEVALMHEHLHRLRPGIIGSIT